MQSNEFKKANMGIVRDITEKRFVEQMSSIDSFATRSGLVLATNGVVFAGYAQLLSDPNWLQGYASILLFPEIILVFFSGFFAFSALALGGEKGRWFYDPDPEKLYRLALEKNTEELEDEATRSMIDAYGKNRDLFVKKFNLLRNSTYSLFGSGFVFIIHLFLFFYY